jgi:dimethylhistidine N-methyltransferase
MLESARVQLPSPSGLDEEGLEVLRGLQLKPRRVSPRYFYDDLGSRLFEEICRQPEYYLTRTETLILKRNAEAIGAEVGAGALIIEPGSGAAEKTGMLMSALDRPAGYVPIEICQEQLQASRARLRSSYPGLPVQPVCADFTGPVSLPRMPPHQRRLIFFPGSTIGNFDLEEALALLRSFRALLGNNGRLLIGVDLVKSRERLERAYDDAAGITARFNLNLLDHLNSRFGADFNRSLFRHAAQWCAEHGRIEMQLWVRQSHTVHFGDTELRFHAGEKLVTEWSHKYTVNGFARLAARAGFHQTCVWTDPGSWFSVQCLAPL